MGIDFGFACRECVAEVTVRYDTSKLGPVELLCSVCGHVSGELVPGYVFRAEHRPSWERVVLGRSLMEPAMGRAGSIELIEVNRFHRHQK